MNTKSTALKQVLFVDDSPSFLKKLRAKMPALSQANWELLFVSDTTKAFTLIETQQVDLIVIDLAMSDMEISQFLKLVHQKHPHIRKAVLSSTLSQSKRSDYLQSGADMCLIKPKRTNGFQDVFHALNQLFTRSQEGFRGLLRTISLTDLIQLECLNTRSSVLEISSGQQVGRVFIKHGAIIHAQAGSKTGVDAFIRLMHMEGGDFNQKPFVEPGTQTIEMSCERLLLEASHAVDNRLAQTNGESMPDTNTSWFSNVHPQTKISSTDTMTEVDSAIDGINFLQIAEPAVDPTDFFPASAFNGQIQTPAASRLDTIRKLTDDLIANRSDLDMKILDLALIKEELNSCKVGLREVISKMQESAKNIRIEPSAADSDLRPIDENKDDVVPLTRFIGSLDEICNNASIIVSQLDGWFATFTEESGSFNETSSKLQSEVACISDAFAKQKQTSPPPHLSEFANFGES